MHGAEAAHGGKGRCQSSVFQWPPPPHGQGAGAGPRRPVLDLRPSDRPDHAEHASMPGRGRRGGAGITGRLPIPGVQLPSGPPLLQCLARHQAGAGRACRAVHGVRDGRRMHSSSVVRYGTQGDGRGKAKRASRAASSSRHIDRMVIALPLCGSAILQVPHRGKALADGWQIAKILCFSVKSTTGGSFIQAARRPPRLSAFLSPTYFPRQGHRNILSAHNRSCACVVSYWP